MSVINCPVLSDGSEFIVGETYYGKSDNKPWKVIGFRNDKYSVVCSNDFGELKELKPEWLMRSPKLYDCNNNKINVGDEAYIIDYYFKGQGVKPFNSEYKRFRVESFSYLRNGDKLLFFVHIENDDGIKLVAQSKWLSIIQKSKMMELCKCLEQWSKLDDEPEYTADEFYEFLTKATKMFNSILEKKGDR